MAVTVEKTLSIGCYFSRLMDKSRSNVLLALRPSHAVCRGARQKIVVILTCRKNNKNQMECPGELIVQVGEGRTPVYTKVESGVTNGRHYFEDLLLGERLNIKFFLRI
jgi:hypothetical protein